jgi:hypothetical protein
MTFIGIGIALSCLAGMFFMTLVALPKHQGDPAAISRISRRFALVIGPLAVLEWLLLALR